MAGMLSEGWRGYLLSLSLALPHPGPSPHGEGESFAVPLRIRAAGFAGRSGTAWAMPGIPWRFLCGRRQRSVISVRSGCGLRLVSRLSGSGGGEGPKSAKTGVFVGNGPFLGVLRTCKRRFLSRETAFPSRLTGFPSLPTASAGLPAALASLPTGFPSRESAFAGQPMAFAGPPSGGASGRARRTVKRGRSDILGPQPRAALVSPPPQSSGAARRLPWAIILSSLQDFSLTRSARIEGPFRVDLCSVPGLL